MRFVGIENENGFYPEGFLGAAFDNETQELVKQWRALPASANPIARLEAVASQYRAMTALIQSKREKDSWADARREATAQLVSALGFTYRRQAIDFDDGSVAPGLDQVADPNGRPLLWVIEAPLPAGDDIFVDPLGLVFSSAQLDPGEAEDLDTDRPIEDIISKTIFRQKACPRYVLVLGVGQAVLVDRNKWASRSVLRFDLREIFERREPETLVAMACLVSREGRTPETGKPLAERIEEEAQRLANAVTTSLKATVRDAIEILGQEVLDVTGGKYPSGDRRGVWIDGADLSVECLRYMYRLLFLFFAEANPKLGLIDLNNPVYSDGYSVEALRSLETVRLQTREDKEGFYFWRSLQRTLGLFFSGEAGASVLRLPAVRTSLLDPDSTPILNKIDLRNEAVQRIIRLLSLRRGEGGARRISYASLGIGQLGAVYETLISFTGIVAKTDLIELKPPSGRGGAAAAEAADDASNADDAGDDDAADDGAGDDGARDEDPDDGAAAPATARPSVDLLAPTWFVPRARAGEFKPEEILYDGPNPRIIRKGSFAYRLSGRDREKSASYYTPEPLARLLVKHTLMEACKDLAADALLELKILEPAMGSAAFLVEATNQLADLYLARKQTELGETLDQDTYAKERQKVRAYISDRNCFGVDLNPIAVELGEISLWLNCLHLRDQKSGADQVVTEATAQPNETARATFTPWFGDQLLYGNSLVGARRAAYPPQQLTARTVRDLWHAQPPQEVGWRARRPDGHVWQFLLPAADMAKFDGDRTIAGFAGEAQANISAWRRGGFFARLTEEEAALAQHLSGVVDTLFDQVSDMLAANRGKMNDAITLWPNKDMGGATGIDYLTKRSRLQLLKGERQISRSLPYQRLKTVMDAWCALWFWPLEEAQRLPDRKAFFRALQMILEGEVDGTGAAVTPTGSPPAMADLVDRMTSAPATSPPGGAAAPGLLIPETTIDRLEAAQPWIKIARAVARRERFLHFDLEYADVLRARGGFDVILGNPPWIKPSWSAGAALADIDPGIVVRNLSATAVRDLAPTMLTTPERRDAFLAAYVSTKGAMAATGSKVMNPFAGAGRNNLYRCFIDLGFRLAAPSGAIGLIHQDGHLGDPQSGAFRRHWYQRIIKHFHFRNEIAALMFAEVDNQLAFSANVYRGGARAVHFDQVTAAFTAAQIDDCYAHDGVGDVPGVKTAEGAFETRGHRDRVVPIGPEELGVIAEVTEAPGVDPLTARFLQPWSRRTLSVFALLSRAPKLGGQADTWQMSPVWNEVTDQRDRKIIRRHIGFRSQAEDMIFSGPLFHVGNPLNKSVGRNAANNRDYECIDLLTCPDDYRPRTIYAPALAPDAYRAALPRCSWDDAKTHVDFYRLAFRRRLALNGERTLIGAIIPLGAAHIDAVESLAFQSRADLLNFSAICFSLPLDFLAKASGKSDLRSSDVLRFPSAIMGDTALSRVLRLSCLTRDYAALWDAEAPGLQPAGWSSDDPRLGLEGPVEGPQAWSRTAGLRTDFARRLALVELDVLAARALGWALEDLLEVYRISFPILQQYDAATWYDQKGRIVWTASKGLPGVGYLDERGRSPGRAAWNAILAANTATLSCEATIDYLPGGPHVQARSFVGPFTVCDRVADYRRAWAFFDAHDRSARP